MRIKSLFSKVGTVATVVIGIATVAKSNRIRAENQSLQQDKTKMLKQIEQLQKDNKNLVAKAEQEERNQLEIREEILTRIDIASNVKAQEKIETMNFLMKQFFDIYSNSKKELEKAKRQKQSTLKVYQAMDKNLSLAIEECLKFSKKISDNLVLERKGEII